MRTFEIKKKSGEVLKSLTYNTLPLVPSMLPKKKFYQILTKLKKTHKIKKDTSAFTR